MAHEPEQALATHARDAVAALHAFESTPELLAFAFQQEGILLWPLVRWGLLHAGLAGVLQQPAAGGAARPKPARRVRHAIEALRADPAHIDRPFDVIIFGSTVGVSTLRNGRWFGRINDYFALEHEDRTLVIDSSAGAEFRAPRYPRHVARHNAISLRAMLRARLPGGGPSDRNVRAVRDFLRHVEAHFPLALDSAVLRRTEQNLRGMAARLRFMRGDYLRLFETTRCKLVAVEGASYGTEAHILKWAHDAGATTAEFQHGVIVPTHLAYNFGPGLRDADSYRPFLPEYLLTYGEFWNDNAATASETIAIGNPHFDVQRRKYERAPGAAAAPRGFVVVSQPDSVRELIELTQELRRLLRDDEIVYRLHPAESRTDTAYAPLERLAGVRISAGGDIYEVFAHAHAVVGASSTALFEAAGLGRQVHVLRTPGADFYMPPGFGIPVHSAQDIVAAQATGDGLSLDPEALFRSDWRERYRQFLAKRGIEAAS